MQFKTRMTPALMAEFTQSGDWRQETFYDLLCEQARLHPDREAIVDAKVRITYQTLKDNVDRTAAFLKARRHRISSGVRQD